MSRTTVNVLADLAERAASHPSIELAVIGAVRATLPGVIASVLRDLYPGETLRLYVPKTIGDDRRLRDQRIGAALATGEAPESIAKRERVSRRHLRRIRARIGGHSPP